MHRVHSVSSNLSNASYSLPRKRKEQKQSPEPRAWGFLFLSFLVGEAIRPTLTGEQNRRSQPSPRAIGYTGLRLLSRAGDLVCRREASHPPFWSSPGRPCDPAVLLLHCLQEFGILARAEAFFPAATIQPGSVRLARGGRSRSWWRTWRFVVGRRDSLPPSPALPGASEVSLGVPSPQPSPEHPGRGGCASLSALARLPPASLA